MRRYRVVLTIILSISLVACLAAPGRAWGEGEIWLTSLDWPPYMGEGLAGNGANAIVVREVLSHLDMELKIIFFPWARTVETAKHDKNFHGYFPEYYAQDIEENFIFSDPIGMSPLGFIEHVDNPIAWSSLEDLRPHRIGTVRGYVNTAKFDAMAEAGELRAEPAADDLTNIRKVGEKRLPLAVIDRYVFEYLMNTDPSLKRYSEVLRFNGKLLENKTLHVCFRRDAEGSRMSTLFNAALGKVDVVGVQTAYFRRALGIDTLQ